MDITRFNPFNWFRKENDAARLPVTRGATATALAPAGPTTFHELHREFDRLFDALASNLGAPVLGRDGLFPAWGREALLRPTLDIAEDEKAYTISIELPGVKAADLAVEVVGDALRVRGEKRQESETKGRNYHRMERTHGTFERVLDLPEDAKADAVEAALRDGVLTITIPRDEAAKTTSRRVDVKVA